MHLTLIVSAEVVLQDILDYRIPLDSKTKIRPGPGAEVGMQCVANLFVLAAQVQFSVLVRVVPALEHAFQPCLQVIAPSLYALPPSSPQHQAEQV